MRNVLTFVSASLFFFNDTAPTEIYTLSLHDALPIWDDRPPGAGADRGPVEGVFEDGSPGRGGGVLQAEERQRGLQVDRHGHGEHRVRHEERADLGQDVPADDPGVTGADRARPLDVDAFLD